MNEKDGVQIKTEFLDKEGQVMLLKLSGFIDQSNSHLLEKTVLNGLESGCYKLIFDFGNLTYMSSAGWGVLVGEIKRFRQYGGDIKLVNLNSDLYEVYQMLEFYHIIDEYPSIEDALDSFTIDQDFNLLVNQPDEKQIQPNTNKKTKEKFVDENNLDNSNDNEHTTKEKSNNSGIIEKEIEIEFGDNSEKDIENYSNNNVGSSNKGHVAFKPLSFERQVDVKILPLAEKVRRIISQFPQLGPFKIKKILQHPDFGNVKVGYFKLKSLLKELDLDTKEKRFRFYRST